MNRCVSRLEKLCLTVSAISGCGALSAGVKRSKEQARYASEERPQADFHSPLLATALGGPDVVTKDAKSLSDVLNPESLDD